MSADYLRNFPEDSPVRRNWERIQTEFSGAVPIQVFIRSDLPNAFKDPVHLRTIEDLERWLEAQPEVGAATSLVDFIGMLHRAFEPDAPAGESIPSSRDGVDDLLFFANGDDLRRVADPRYESTLLHVRTSAVSTNDLGGLIHRIERRIEELPGHLRGEVTGSSALLSRTLDNIIRGQLTSLVGALAAATLLVAWVADLTFTPALSGRLRFVTLWEVLAVDLGAAPHKTIPFFFGLTHREARIAAILGSFETFRAGEHILRLGDTGTDIHVVIDGELRASVPRNGNEQVLRRLKRGDFIGEVALFHGLRTANVHAQSDARLLRLSNACLDRIQARYPQIAAQLYCNPGVILADQLADVIERL